MQFMLLSSLTYKWLFKCQISTVARAPINLNAHCRAIFSHSDEKGVHLMGQICPICLLKVKNQNQNFITDSWIIQCYYQYPSICSTELQVDELIMNRIGCGPQLSRPEVLPQCSEGRTEENHKAVPRLILEVDTCPIQARSVSTSSVPPCDKVLFGKQPQMSSWNAAHTCRWNGVCCFFQTCMKQVWFISTTHINFVMQMATLDMAAGLKFSWSIHLDMAQCIYYLWKFQIYILHLD